MLRPPKQMSKPSKLNQYQSSIEATQAERDDALRQSEEAKVAQASAEQLVEAAQTRQLPIRTPVWLKPPKPG